MSIAAPPLVRSAAPAISPDEAIREVEENLVETRRRIIRQRIATGALRLFAIGAIALGLIAAIDCSFELAAAWRGLALLSIVGGTIALGGERLAAVGHFVHAPRGGEGCRAPRGGIRPAPADDARL